MKIVNFYERFKSKIPCFGADSFGAEKIKGILTDARNDLAKMTQAQMNRLGGQDGVAEYEADIDYYISKIPDAEFYKRQADGFFQEKYGEIISAVEIKIGVKKQITTDELDGLVQNEAGGERAIVDKVLQGKNVAVTDRPVAVNDSLKLILPESVIDEYAVMLEKIEPTEAKHYFLGTMAVFGILPKNLDLITFKNAIQVFLNGVNYQDQNGSLKGELAAFALRYTNNEKLFLSFMLSLVYYSPSELLLGKKFANFASDGLSTDEALTLYKELYARIENKELAVKILEIWAGKSGVDFSIDDFIDGFNIEYVACPVCETENNPKNAACTKCKTELKTFRNIINATAELNMCLIEQDKEKGKKLYDGLRKQYLPEGAERYLTGILAAAKKNLEGKLLSKEDQEIRKLQTLFTEADQNSRNASFDDKEKQRFRNKAIKITDDMLKINPNNMRAKLYNAYAHYMNGSTTELKSFLISYTPKKAEYDDDFAFEQVEWIANSKSLFSTYKEYLDDYIKRVVQDKQKQREAYELYFKQNAAELSLHDKIKSFAAAVSEQKLGGAFADGFLKDIFTQFKESKTGKQLAKLPAKASKGAALASKKNAAVESLADEYLERLKNNRSIGVDTKTLENELKVFKSAAKSIRAAEPSLSALREVDAYLQTAEATIGIVNAAIKQANESNAKRIAAIEKKRRIRSAILAAVAYIFGITGFVVILGSLVLTVLSVDAENWFLRIAHGFFIMPTYFIGGGFYLERVSLFMSGANYALFNLMFFAGLAAMLIGAIFAGAAGVRSCGKTLRRFVSVLRIIVILGFICIFVLTYAYNTEGVLQNIFAALFGVLLYLIGYGFWGTVSVVNPGDEILAEVFPLFSIVYYAAVAAIIILAILSAIVPHNGKR
jgi:hypothetical protein